jgi:hypothetical protein
LDEWWRNNNIIIAINDFNVDRDYQASQEMADTPLEVIFDFLPMNSYQLMWNMLSTWMQMWSS